MKLLPERRAITAFGDGGFRFGDHSHRGALLVLPAGMQAWDGKDLSEVIAVKDDLDFFLLGTGASLRRIPLPPQLRTLQCDCMTTPAAVHSYNYMLAEGRRVAAAFIAVP